MTVKELYDWAIKNEVENCEIESQNWDGSFSNINPYIKKGHYKDGTEFIVIEV